MAETVRERLDALRQAQKGKAPSMVPQTRAERAKSEEAPTPDVRELGLEPADADSLMRLAAQHVLYGTEERTAKQMKSSVTERMKRICNDYSLRKCRADDLTISYYAIPRVTIDAALLKAHGVKPEVIAACTIKSESWALRVTAPGQKDE